jgi:hypothetical protein
MNTRPHFWVSTLSSATSSWYTTPCSQEKPHYFESYSNRWQQQFIVQTIQESHANVSNKWIDHYFPKVCATEHWYEMGTVEACLKIYVHFFYFVSKHFIAIIHKLNQKIPWKIPRLYPTSHLGGSPHMQDPSMCLQFQNCIKLCCGSLDWETMGYVY